MKQLLVTGSHGFVGTTLSRMLAAKSARPTWRLTGTPADFDVRDARHTLEVVTAAKPDAVIHLAAASAIPEAFRNPANTLDINVMGTLHLLEALKKTGFSGRMLFAGTGDVYGSVPEDALPVAEDRLPAPRNPYAVSKLAAEALCYQWFASDGMQIMLARPFNHIGPGQSDKFVVSDFAKQLIEIRLGRRDPVVHVGDIDVTRDFTDVRDVVNAYLALLDHGAPGQIYNVCSGVERSIRSLLLQLIELAGVEVAIDTDPQRFRHAEQRRVRGDPEKIKNATQWHASTPIEDSLSSTLDYWEEQLKNG